MIKKLRRKFIFIFMTLTLTTLAGIFIFMFWSTSRQMEADCRASLNRHLSEPSPHQIRHTSNVILILKYSASGRQINKIINNGQMSFSDTELEEIANISLSSEKEYGNIQKYSLAYMKKRHPGGDIRIAFYDLHQNKTALRQLCFSFLPAGILAFFIFYIISYFLSSWCIHPIEESWNKQQKFIADASHELKTPLTIILANTAIIREHKHEPVVTKEKCLTYIEEEARHMSRLVNDMLFLAKTDAYHETQKKEPVNFSDICINSYLTFECIAFEKQIEINSEIKEHLIINGIKDKLEQLCTILLDNACKYTEKQGSIFLTLTKKGSTVIFTIHNTGKGISQKHLPHLFERFYRADEARTRAQGGYGLGLSIASSIVQMHHGKISISSSDETGTTVRVELPCTEKL